MAAMGLDEGGLFSTLLKVVPDDSRAGRPPSRIVFNDSVQTLCALPSDTVRKPSTLSSSSLEWSLSEGRFEVDLSSE